MLFNQVNYTGQNDKSEIKSNYNHTEHTKWLSCQWHLDRG